MKKNLNPQRKLYKHQPLMFLELSPQHFEVVICNYKYFKTENISCSSCLLLLFVGREGKCF